MEVITRQVKECGKNRIHSLKKILTVENKAGKQKALKHRFRQKE
jgi:hypothetical protein